MTVEVCITVDVEFSIGGTFANPKNRRPIGEEIVHCICNGQEHGLGFILNTFRTYDTNATFFVEALNTAYFGDVPMGRITERILSHNQDIQLHIHPVWLHFRHSDWEARLQNGQPNGRCDGRSLDEMSDFIGTGLEALHRWGISSPKALRTGSLRADKTVYKAMEHHELTLASNLGVAYHRPTDPELYLTGGRHWIGRVLEVPILSYTQIAVGSRWRKHLLTITGSSWPEIKAMLWQARAIDLSPVVILTHPFEFIKGSDRNTERATRNRINKTRLVRVCEFIAENPADFVSASFGEAGPRWLEEKPVASPDLTAPVSAVLLRIIENKANDLIRAL